MSLRRKIGRISNCLFCLAEAASEQSARNVKIMNRVVLKRLWNRSTTDQNFHRLLLALLSAFVWPCQSRQTS